MCLVWQWIFKTLFSFDALDKQAFIFHCAARMKKTMALYERLLSVWTLVSHAGTELNARLDAAWRWKNQLTAGSSSWHQRLAPHIWHRKDLRAKALTWLVRVNPLYSSPAPIFSPFSNSTTVFTIFTITDKHKQVAHWHFLKYLPKPHRAPDAHNYFWVSRS